MIARVQCDYGNPMVGPGQVSRSGFHSRLPPSTGMIVPLTKVIVVASPRITASTSSGSAIRLSGLLASL